jgi:metal-dependent hydrolase (beta-lactamase superfamily II)
VTTAGQPPSLSTPGLGVWRHTDGDTYSAVSEAFVFNPAGAWIQTHRLTRAIEIGNDADEFTDTVTLQIFDTNGNLIVTGCATSVAHRFE